MNIDPEREVEFLEFFPVDVNVYRRMVYQLVQYLYKVPPLEARDTQWRYAQNRIWKWAMSGWRTGRADTEQQEPVLPDPKSFAYRWATDVGREKGRKERMK